MYSDSISPTKLFNNRSKYIFIITQFKYFITSYLNLDTQENLYRESYNYPYIIDEKVVKECDLPKSYSW